MRFPKPIFMVRGSFAPRRAAGFTRSEDHEQKPDGMRIRPGSIGATRAKVALDHGTRDTMAMSLLEGAGLLQAAIESRGRERLIAVYDDVINSHSTRERIT